MQHRRVSYPHRTTGPRGRLRERLRRAGLLAGALAFLFQMMIWSVYAPAMAFGLLTPICTAEGVRLVLADQVGDDRPADTDADGRPDQAVPSADDCPLCLLVQGSSTPPLPIMAPAPRLVRLHDATPLPGGLIAAGWYLATLKARAPPIGA